MLLVKVCGKNKITDREISKLKMCVLGLHTNGDFRVRPNDLTKFGDLGV